MTRPEKQMYYSKSIPVWSICPQTSQTGTEHFSHRLLMFGLIWEQLVLLKCDIQSQTR